MAAIRSYSVVIIVAGTSLSPRIASTVAAVLAVSACPIGGTQPALGRLRVWRLLVVRVAKLLMAA
jgi:hypothetical protein